MKRTVIALACLGAALSHAHAAPVLDATFIQNNWNFSLDLLVTSPDPVHLYRIFINGTPFGGLNTDDSNPGDATGQVFVSNFSGVLPLDFEPAAVLGLGLHTISVEYVQFDQTFTDPNAYQYTVTQPTGERPADPREVAPAPDSGSAFTLASLASVLLLGSHRFLPKGKRA